MRAARGAVACFQVLNGGRFRPTLGGETHNRPRLERLLRGCRAGHLPTSDLTKTSTEMDETHRARSALYLHEISRSYTFWLAEGAFFGRGTWSWPCRVSRFQAPNRTITIGRIYGPESSLTLRAKV